MYATILHVSSHYLNTTNTLSMHQDGIEHTESTSTDVENQSKHQTIKDQLPRCRGHRHTELIFGYNYHLRQQQDNDNCPGSNASREGHA
jgi:hypothetical protein